jgi:pyruvate dehydrogenase E1 component alpha subunit
VTDTVAVTPELQRFLDPEGRAVRPLPAFAEEPGALISLYRAMALTRTFDAKAIALQRTGRLGTYASSLGQEAVAVGIGAAMTPEDVLLPSFRELGAQILRGITLDELLLFWGGDERGSNFKGPREDFPICVPVGSHGPHAAGVALAFKLRRQLRVAVCVLGDGATSKGDVYEAMNLAGVWRLPLVFVVNNNGPPLRGAGLGDGARGRRSDADRGGHLSPERPHHGGRRQPLSRRRDGRQALERGAVNSLAPLSHRGRPLGQGRRRTPARDL